MFDRPPGSSPIRLRQISRSPRGDSRDSALAGLHRRFRTTFARAMFCKELITLSAADMVFDVLSAFGSSNFLFFGRDHPKSPGGPGSYRDLKQFAARLTAPYSLAREPSALHGRKGCPRGGAWIATMATMGIGGPGTLFLTETRGPGDAFRGTGLAFYWPKGNLQGSRPTDAMLFKEFRQGPISPRNEADGELHVPAIDVSVGPIRAPLHVVRLRDRAGGIRCSSNPDATGTD